MKTLAKHLIAAVVCAVASTALAQEEPSPLSAAFDPSAWRRGRIEHVGAQKTPDGKSRQRIGSAATAPIPVTGSPRVPVVLVQFSDKSFAANDEGTEAKETYEAMMNAGEGVHPATSYCSVREYFRTQSDGLFTPQFTVIGPVTLSESYAYYGKNRGSARDVNIGDFYREACQLTAKEDVDWNAFDNDGDGRVDFVFFIYAGEGENGCDDPNTIWPKESVSSLSVSYDDGEGGKHEVRFAAYGCANELYKGAQDGIGCFVHEMGHGLGLPDLYDTTGKAFGMDFWDIMDSGCYQMMGCMPCCMSAYERDFMGWKPLEELTPGEARTLTLLPLSQGGTAYKITNPANPDEYFILENRQNTGCDTYLGWRNPKLQDLYGSNHGLLITHVDFSAIAWAANSVNTMPQHQRLTIVPADGELVTSIGVNTTEALERWAKSLRGDFYPGATETTRVAELKVYTGDALEDSITNIVEHDDGSVTLDLNGGDPVPDDPNEEPEIPEIA